MLSVVTRQGLSHIIERQLQRHKQRVKQPELHRQTGTHTHTLTDPHGQVNKHPQTQKDLQTVLKRHSLKVFLCLNVCMCV